MSIASRANASLRQLALSAGLGVIVLTVILAGLGFLTAATYVQLTQRFPAAEAAALTGGGLIAFAILLGAIGAFTIRKLKKPQPSMLSEIGGTFGLATRLVGMMVRRDPKKAIILAAVTGAVAEYVMSDNRK
jgi:hypothetical protein